MSRRQQSVPLLCALVGATGVAGVLALGRCLESPAGNLAGGGGGLSKAEEDVPAPMKLEDTSGVLATRLRAGVRGAGESGGRVLELAERAARAARGLGTVQPDEYPAEARHPAVARLVCIACDVTEDSAARARACGLLGQFGSPPEANAICVALESILSSGSSAYLRSEAIRLLPTDLVLTDGLAAALARVADADEGLDGVLAGEALWRAHRADRASVTRWVERGLNSSKELIVDATLECDWLSDVEGSALPAPLGRILVDRRSSQWPLGLDSVSVERRYRAIAVCSALQLSTRTELLRILNERGEDGEFGALAQFALGIDSAESDVIVGFLASESFPVRWVSLRALQGSGKEREPRVMVAMLTAGGTSRSLVAVLRPWVCSLTAEDVLALRRHDSRESIEPLLAPWWSGLEEKVKNVARFGAKGSEGNN